MGGAAAVVVAAGALPIEAFVAFRARVAVAAGTRLLGMAAAFARVASVIGAGVGVVAGNGWIQGLPGTRSLLADIAFGARACIIAKRGIGAAGTAGVGIAAIVGAGVAVITFSGLAPTGFVDAGVVLGAIVAVTAGLEIGRVRAGTTLWIAHIIGAGVAIVAGAGSPNAFSFVAMIALGAGAAVIAFGGGGHRRAGASCWCTRLRGAGVAVIAGLGRSSLTLAVVACVTAGASVAIVAGACGGGIATAAVGAQITRTRIAVVAASCGLAVAALLISAVLIAANLVGGLSVHGLRTGDDTVAARTGACHNQENWQA